MIISVATTVIGATIIYFLGFNKKPGISKLEREEATVNAWKTYVTVENIYTKASASLLRDIPKTGLEDFLSQSLKESEKFQASLDGLITDDAIDKDLISLLKRRQENEKTQFAKAEKLFNRFIEMSKSEKIGAMTEQQIKDTVMVEMTRSYEQSKGLIDRSVSEIEDLSNTLSDRYDQLFSMNDFLVIQVFKYKKDIFRLIDGDTTTVAPPVGPPSTKATEGNGNNSGQPAIEVTKEYLTGKWNSKGVIMTLKGDGNCSWLNPATRTETKGKWQLKTEQLVMNLVENKTGKKMEWIFDLSGVSGNTFNLKLTADNNQNYYTMERM